MSQQNGTFGGSVKTGSLRRKKLIISGIILVVVLAVAGAAVWWYVRDKAAVSRAEEATSIDTRVNDIDKAAASAESKDQKAGLLYFKAQAYESEGNLPAAATAYEQMIQEKPSASGYLQLARLYHRMERDADARAQYQKAIDAASPEEKQYYQDQLKGAGV